MPQELAHVDDAAEQVAQPIEVLDDQSQLFARGVQRRCADPLDNRLDVQKCAIGESAQVARGLYRAVEKHAIVTPANVEKHGAGIVEMRLERGLIARRARGRDRYVELFVGKGGVRCGGETGGVGTEGRYRSEGRAT